MLFFPLENGRSHSFEQTWIYFTQGYFVPSLVEICPVVLEKKIFKLRQYIFTLWLLSPLGKRHDPSFEKTWIPFTQGWFVPSLLKLFQWFWRRRNKCEKFMRTTTPMTDNGQILIRKAHLSLWLRWANNKIWFPLNLFHNLQCTCDRKSECASPRWLSSLVNYFFAESAVEHKDNVIYIVVLKHLFFKIHFYAPLLCRVFVDFERILLKTWNTPMVMARQQQKWSDVSLSGLSHFMLYPSE